MCHKNTSSVRNTSSPAMSLRMAKVTILLIIFYLIQDAAGSCINYGHSCWGAHGKRNDLTSKNTEAKEEMTSNNAPFDTRWFLARLSPATYKLIKNQRDFEMQPMKDTEIGESVPMKRNQPEDDIVDYQDLPLMLDTYYPEVLHSKSLNEKLKFLNYLKAQKLNN